MVASCQRVVLWATGGSGVVQVVDSGGVGGRRWKRVTEGLWVWMSIRCGVEQPETPAARARATDEHSCCCRREIVALQLRRFHISHTRAVIIRRQTTLCDTPQAPRGPVAATDSSECSRREAVGLVTSDARDAHHSFTSIITDSQAQRWENDQLPNPDAAGKHCQPTLAASYSIPWWR